MSNFKFENGDAVKDKITSFSGIVMGRTDWLTGCNTIGVMPKKLDEKGQIQDIKWIDENRLELIEKKQVIINEPKLHHEIDPGGPIISIPQQNNRR